MNNEPFEKRFENISNPQTKITRMSQTTNVRTKKY